MNQEKREKREKFASLFREYRSLLIIAMLIVGLGVAVSVSRNINSDVTTSVLPTSVLPVSTGEWVDQAILYPLSDTTTIPSPQGKLQPTATVAVTPTILPTETITVFLSTVVETPVPSKTPLPTSTLAIIITPTVESVICHDDLAEVQAVLSDQWSVLDPHTYPRRIYYDSKPWRFDLRLVSSGNFYVQTRQLGDGSEVWLDIVSAYSVDDDNNLYAIDVALGAQYVGEPYTLFTARWSPFEAQITNLDEAKEMLARGRLFSISMSDFVTQADTIIWKNCPNVDWYAEYFGKHACELGQIVEESQVSDFVTTLARGYSPPEGHNMLLAGWVIYIPNKKTGATEYGYLNMPDCK